jgi:hypothetical protein
MYIIASCIIVAGGMAGSKTCLQSQEGHHRHAPSWLPTLGLAALLCCIACLNPKLILLNLNVECMQNPAFLAANPGLGYDFQMINVPDYNGKGESEPAPYYFQNLGEAEYIVAVYR